MHKSIASRAQIPTFPSRCTKGMSRENTDSFAICVWWWFSRKNRSNSAISRLTLTQSPFSTATKCSSMSDEMLFTQECKRYSRGFQTCSYISKGALPFSIRFLNNLSCSRFMSLTQFLFDALQVNTVWNTFSSRTYCKQGPGSPSFSSTKTDTISFKWYTKILHRSWCPIVFSSRSIIAFAFFQCTSTSLKSSEAPSTKPSSNCFLSTSELGDWRGDRDASFFSKLMTECRLEKPHKLVVQLGKSYYAHVSIIRLPPSWKHGSTTTDRMIDSIALLSQSYSDSISVSYFQQHELFCKFWQQGSFEEVCRSRNISESN